MARVGVNVNIIGEPTQDKEVLAINIYNDYLIGYLRKQDNGTYNCESEESLLENVTKYIIMEEILREE